MRGEDNLSTRITGKANGRKGEDNPGIVGNIALLVLRDIKIDSNKNTCPFQFNLIYGANWHQLLPPKSFFCNFKL